MTKRAAGGQVKFLTTKLAVGGGAVVAFLGLWGAVAAGSDTGESGDNWESTDSAQEPIIQDGWVWDAAAGEWKLAAPAAEATQPAAATAAGETIIVERQPVYYVTEYVTVPGAPAAVQGAATVTANGSGNAPAGSATPAANAGPAFVAAVGEPAAPVVSFDPPAAVLPEAPVAAAPVTIPPAPPPVVVQPAAPPPPPPAPAPAPKKSRGS